MTNQQTQSFNFDSNHINKTEQEFPHKRPYNEMNTGFILYFIFDLEEKILKILCSGSGNVMGVVSS